MPSVASCQFSVANCPVGVGGGFIDGVEELAGAAKTDGAVGHGLRDLIEGSLSAFEIETVGHFDRNQLGTGFLGADGALGAGVEVTGGLAARDGRLAMESTGHDITTLGDHRVLSCG